MPMVWPCRLSVEAYARAGKKVVAPRLGCPACAVPMTFRSGYWRYVRAGTDFRIWVRRAECPRCGVSRALLPSFCLVRRLDTVEVVGATVAGALDGQVVAVPVGVGATTARAWVRRHRERAPALVAAARHLVPRLPGLGAPARPLSFEVEGLWAVQAVAAALWVGLGTWAAVSLLTSGAWLAPATTTDPPRASAFSTAEGAVMVPATPQDSRRPP